MNAQGRPAIQDLVRMTMEKSASRAQIAAEGSRQLQRSGSEEHTKQASAQDPELTTDFAEKLANAVEFITPTVLKQAEIEATKSKTPFPTGVTETIDGKNPVGTPASLGHSKTHTVPLHSPMEHEGKMKTDEKSPIGLHTHGQPTSLQAGRGKAASEKEESKEESKEERMKRILGKKDDGEKKEAASFAGFGGAALRGAEKVVDAGRAAASKMPGKAGELLHKGTAAAGGAITKGLNNPAKAGKLIAGGAALGGAGALAGAAMSGKKKEASENDDAKVASFRRAASSLGEKGRKAGVDAWEATKDLGKSIKDKAKSIESKKPRSTNLAVGMGVGAAGTHGAHKALNHHAKGKEKKAEDAINPARITAGKAVPPETSDSTQRPKVKVDGPTHVMDSAQSAINFTKRDAFANIKRDNAAYWREKMLTQSADPVLNEAFAHTRQAGAKIASIGGVEKTAAARQLLANLADQVSGK